MSEHAEVRATVRNRLGMHARPAMVFADHAAAFASEIRVHRADAPGERIDAKSVMQVMMLAATQHTELVITAEGDDAAPACRALADLIESGFGEAS